MDLIYTNAQRVDQGVLTTHAFDLSFGKSENDFELVLGANEPMLEYGAFVYCDGTEYGGIIDARKTGTNSETVTYKGRTWHGIINSKVVQPDPGADYFIVSGDVHAVLAQLVERLGLGGLFVADESASGIAITDYKFHRYCMGYDGIRDMLADNGAKLNIKWEGRTVKLSALPIVDYSAEPVDGDMAALTVERYEKKVNHLIALGAGELSEREVIHLYVNQSGEIVDTQFFFGLDEIAETYDFSSVATSEELRTYSVKQLKELRDNDTAEIDFASNDPSFDIGDIVGAEDIKSGVTVTAAVTQKIVSISNGTVSIEYKTGKGE
jgi:hypothetical protein